MYDTPDPQVPFDGMWIDMNEASNFCEGEVCTLTTQPTHTTRTTHSQHSHSSPQGPPRTQAMANCELQCKQPPPGSKLAYPPYAIHNQGSSKAALGSKTLPMSARHVDGQLLYDTHNLYGLSEAAATCWALQEITGKRPFILTRWVVDDPSCVLQCGSLSMHVTGCLV